MQSLEKCPLGKQTAYKTSYDSSLLFSVSRKETRGRLSISLPPPFDGVDIWNAYELSWLNPKGKPLVAIAQYILPCSSPYLIESKSFKMYLHSFNQSHFSSVEEVRAIMEKDLSKAAGKQVKVHIWMPHEFKHLSSGEFEGDCLDGLDISTDVYEIDPSLLKTEPKQVEEKLYSNLLKSNCLVTMQPDWGHVYIHYRGKQIDHASLLKYIISYRNHNGFHEQCIEQMFMDILTHCKPEKLTVYGRYTRRGGLDISPYRSNCDTHPPSSASWRLYRQ